MKKILVISTLIFAFYASIFSQTSKTLPCPTVTINSNFPLGLREPITFTANIDGNIGDYMPEYVWTIKDGNILEGQGTASIKALPKFDYIIASVEIKGLAEGCSPTDDDSIIICPPPSSYLIDRFSSQATRIDKARLDNLISELQNNPSAKGYIIEYFVTNTPQKIIDRKLQKIRDYLFKIKGQDKDRFTVTNKSSSIGENMTAFWIVPAGASLPDIDD